MNIDSYEALLLLSIIKYFDKHPEERYEAFLGFASEDAQALRWLVTRMNDFSDSQGLVIL